MNNDRISEIRARCEAATKGPWGVKTNAHRETSGEAWGWIDGPSNNWCWSDRRPKDRANAELAAHARQDIPFLLTQLVERDAEIERLREAQRCDGCSSKGQYENEVECGYPSPCTGCVRRAPDNFMPLPTAPEEGAERKEAQHE